MIGPRHATAKASRPARRPTERSRKKIGKGFLADLKRAWRKHGRETLERLSVERPDVCFKVIVRLAEIHQRRLPKPREFDRKGYRAELMERLRERVEATREQSRAASRSETLFLGSRRLPAARFPYSKMSIARQRFNVPPKQSRL
jgi:hypothetical protein